MAARQIVRTIPEQIQAGKILRMGLPELQSFVEQQVLENPALAVEESARCPLCGSPLSDSNSCRICGSSLDSAPSRDADEDDYVEPESFHSADFDDDFDPFGSVAAETDLQSHLHRQSAAVFEGHRLIVADYIIDSLDDKGYFTESLLETANLFGLSVPELRAILDEIQTFDPVGIAATDVRECILIQLRQRAELPEEGELALRVAEECWEELSSLKLQAIADKLSADTDDVRAALEFISSELTPYPASLYRAPWQEFAPTKVAKIVPDVVMRETEEGLSVEVVDFRLGTLKIDEIYEAVYKQVRGKDGGSFSEEGRKHVTEQVNNARCVLEAIELRKTTLARMSLHLAQEQRDFVLKGRQYVKPMTQKQVAESLGVHESTISRAVTEKHVQLPSGEVVSFDLFIDAALPIKEKILQRYRAPS
jgi:RNA polymerase sigma-54 factor